MATHTGKGERPAAPAHLEVRDLSVSYRDKLALADVNFVVPEGTHVAVVGPNGAGKSTLFKALVGLLPPRTGQILIHGLPRGHRLDCVAYVPQREEVDWHFPVTVSDVVLMGRYGTLGWLQRPGPDDRKAVRRCLEQLEIANLSERPIGQLSGGQQQRVFLARALVQEPHILLMDEPFTGVDMMTQEATLQLLEDLRAQHVTVMVSTHDLNLAAQRFEKVMLLKRHVVSFGSPSEAFSPAALGEAFGGQLLFLEGKAALVDECCAGDERSD